MLFMTVLHAGTAAAQSAPKAMGAPTAEVVKKADALFQEANRLVAQKKWAEAEAKLLEARALNPSFDITTNLGHTQVRLGKYRQAATNLALALRNWPVIGAMASKRAIAVKQLDEVRPFVAEVSVSVNVPDAAIFVDGERVGTSPMKETIFLDPGTHKIEATLAGHERGTQKLEAAKGSTPSVTLTLKPSSGAPAVGTPSKTELVAAAQPEMKQPEVKTQPLQPQPIRTQPIQQEPTPQGAKLSVRTIVIGAGIATSAVLVGTGIGLAVASSQKGAGVSTRLDELEKQDGPSPCFVPWRNVSACNEVVKLSNEQSTLTNGAIWTFIAGGVVGAGTLAYTLITRKKPESTAVQVHPVVGAGSAAVVVRGQW
jgi:hypothetical protein